MIELPIYEELAIDLTRSEKSTFLRFLTLYLGSSFILMLLVVFLYYQNEKRLYIDLTKSNLQNIVSSVSNEIIVSHMRGTFFDKQKYLNDKRFEISFYNAAQKKLFGTLNDAIDFSKQVVFENQKFILVDSSTVGHLGIEYVVIKDNSLWQKLESLKSDITLFFLLVYAMIGVVGFYLAKLFLKPIKNERERINTFIKDTTHELNTPISALLMSTETQGSTPLNNKQMERIRLSAKRISEMYKDLTYIFLQEDVSQNHVSSYALNELIEEQLHYFEPLIVKKNIALSVKCEVFRYTINKDDFIRLFNNLISNAIKYNKRGGSIEVLLEDKKLIVKDSGIGIAKQKQKDIFKRYVRATSEQGGFGIGLHIVSHICNKYDIDLKVESKVKEGTVFILTF